MVGSPRRSCNISSRQPFPLPLSVRTELWGGLREGERGRGWGGVMADTETAQMRIITKVEMTVLPKY